MEPASLVIGGVALIGLFDSCMSLFNAIDSGKNCGKEYSKAALKVTLIGQRLSRWATAYRHVRPNSTREEGETAKATLQNILQCLKDAQARGQKYGAGESSSEDSQAIARVTDAVQQTMMAGVSNKLSVGKRFWWAVHDKDKFKDNIKHMTSLVMSLEAISNNALAQFLWQARDAAAMSVVHPAAVEEPDDALPENTTAILKEAASRVDPQFNQAIANRGHEFRNFEVDAEDVQLFTGDHVADGQTASGYGSVYDGFKIKGKAKVFVGNKYGGKDPLENW